MGVVLFSNRIEFLTMLFDLSSLMRQSSSKEAKSDGSEHRERESSESHLMSRLLKSADRSAKIAKVNTHDMYVYESGRQTDGNGFSARHSRREYGYYEQFRGSRSGPERHYE